MKGISSEVLGRAQGLQPGKYGTQKIFQELKKTYFIRRQDRNSKSAAKEFAETRKDVLTAERHLKKFKRTEWLR